MLDGGWRGDRESARYNLSLTAVMRATRDSKAHDGSRQQENKKDKICRELSSGF